MTLVPQRKGGVTGAEGEADGDETDETEEADDTALDSRQAVAIAGLASERPMATTPERRVSFIVAGEFDVDSFCLIVGGPLFWDQVGDLSICNGWKSLGNCSK